MIKVRHYKTKKKGSKTYKEKDKGYISNLKWKN